MMNKKLVIRGCILLATVMLSAPGALFANEEAASTSSLADMAGKATAVAEKLNINTASVEQLSNIPGIGEKIGEAIAKYREVHGQFQSIADLVNVEGIDATMLEKIEPFLTI